MDPHKRRIPRDISAPRLLDQGLLHDTSVGDLVVTIRRRQRRRLWHCLCPRDTFGANLCMTILMRHIPRFVILGPFRATHARILDRSAVAYTWLRKLAQAHERQ